MYPAGDSHTSEPCGRLWDNIFALLTHDPMIEVNWGSETQVNRLTLLVRNSRKWPERIGVIRSQSRC